MSGFLSRLVERTLGLATPVQPALASRYAPAPDAGGAPEPPELREQFEESVAPPRRSPARERGDRAPALTARFEAERPAPPRDAPGPEAPPPEPALPMPTAPPLTRDQAADTVEAPAPVGTPGDHDAPLVPRALTGPATSFAQVAMLPPTPDGPAPGNEAQPLADGQAPIAAGEERVRRLEHGAEHRPFSALHATEPPLHVATADAADTLLPPEAEAAPGLVEERREAVPAARTRIERTRQAAAHDRADADGDPARAASAPPLARSATQEAAAAPLLPETASQSHLPAMGQQERRAAPAPPPAPAVRVSIGRIEVRAIQPTPPPAPTTPRRSGPRVSLEDYLRGRERGAR